MEPTGVYCKPVWHILSDGVFELVLVNAMHIKNVPGRKSDVKDSDWISDLLADGLIRPSFVPDGPNQEIRTLLRTRKQLSREKASHILRIQKTLEDANGASILTAIYHMLKDGNHVSGSRPQPLPSPRQGAAKASRSAACRSRICRRAPPRFSVANCTSCSPPAS
jgi:transposase